MFFKRFIRRLHNLFRFSEMWEWKYESCNRCGNCYRLYAIWTDNIWMKVNGKENGCLCPSCFIGIAQKKGINLLPKNIERLVLFDPDGIEGKGYIIIDKEKQNEENLEH